MKKLLILTFILTLTASYCFAYDVTYNEKTNKFHNKNCHLTRNCTNCKTIDIDEAIEIKADPCEKCRKKEQNTKDVRDYKERKRKEREEELRKTPGVKKFGNFTYTIK